MTCNHGPAPPPAVLQAFGLSGTPVPLAGGQGECYILTDSITQQKIILKPAQNLEETEFLSSLQASLHALGPQGYRIAVPVSLLKPNTDPPLSYTALTTPTASEPVIAWTAAHHLSGQGDPAVNLPSLLPASRALHASLLTLYPPSTPPPAYITDRTDRWAHGDRFAWDELTLSTIPAPVSDSLIANPLGPWLDRLQGLLTPVADLLNDPDPTVSRLQVIHGDLSGNLLFDYADDNTTTTATTKLTLSPPAHPTSNNRLLPAPPARRLRRRHRRDGPAPVAQRHARRPARARPGRPAARLARPRPAAGARRAVPARDVRHRRGRGLRGEESAEDGWRGDRGGAGGAGCADDRGGRGRGGGLRVSSELGRGYRARAT